MKRKQEIALVLSLAMALVLGLAQCKKKVEQITPAAAIKMVDITLGVDGTKHVVYPGTGVVAYTDGDVLHVGNNGKYLGTLTYSDGVFSGSIAEPSTADYLHFFFVGGLTPSEAPEIGSTTSFTVNIADQSTKLPVLSYGKSTEKYTDASSVYSTVLMNRCGLVKFVPSAATSNDITVGGMKTTATIDFATPGITPTATTGNITLYSESDAAKWAILLVQDEVSTPTVTISGYDSTITSVPTVTENMYYTTGVSIAMEPAAYIDANFTVAPGTTVKFSKGNLQYNKETGKFSFMEHQYSTVETLDQVVGDDYANQNIVSLFGWGTSGWNNGNYFYQPYNTSNSTSSPYTSSVGNGYGPTDGSTYTYSLTGTYANADWGVYNKQSNHNKIEGGGDHAWRVLTSAEWAYLFNTRSNTTVNNVENARFTKTAITTPGSTTVNGLIIFPDSYSGDTPSGVTWGTINGTIYGYTTTCTADGWAALEAAGCVFLPAAGYRNGTSVGYVGSNGGYWSSTSHESDADLAYRVRFSSDDLAPQRYYRYFGYSVRLARVVE